MNQKIALNKKVILTKLNNEKRIILLEEVPSTNLHAKEIAKKVNEDIIIVANSQTNGKGRLGRSFSSNKDKGIYLSYLIRPNIKIEDCTLLTPLACVATCKAIEENANIDCKIKWVNDIYVSNKKICGILVESSITKDNKFPDYLVIGIGINCYRQSFPSDVEMIATTIEDETNDIVSRNSIISSIINYIDEYVKSFDSNAFIDEYRKRSCVINKQVEIRQGNTSYLGKAIDIQKDGSLKVLLHNNIVKTINSGEITKMVIKDDC